MDLQDYKASIEKLPHGKRLPSALYIFRTPDLQLDQDLATLLVRLIQQFSIGEEYNLLKFRTDELKLSFLSYPDFFNDAHPSLRKAVTVDLVTGKARHTDYSDNLNPPILHRKETFLPPDHPRHAEFAALTRAEESAGLYEETTTIGFKLNWEKLLTSKRLIIIGHSLGPLLQTAVPEGQPNLAQDFSLGFSSPQNSSPEGMAETSPSPPNGHSAAIRIDRHKTAISRYELSKPVKSLLEYGLLKNGTTFFDCGCGQGADFRGLQALGYDSEGWDPVHRPDISKRPQTEKLIYYRCSKRLKAPWNQSRSLRSSVAICSIIRREYGPSWSTSTKKSQARIFSQSFTPRRWLLQ